MAHNGGNRRDQQREMHAPKPNSPDTQIELPNLPYEMIVEILLRLPAKPLIRFKCVCKKWKSLISSKDFVKKHLNLAKNTPEIGRLSRLVLSRIRPHFDIKSCSLVPLLNRESNVGSVKFSNPVRNLHQFAWVVGCCDGLVCIHTKPYTMVLWNPGTRFRMKVSIKGAFEPSVSGSVFGFGYDNVNDDYKVVCICYFYGGEGTRFYVSTVHVFSTRGNSWKSIQDCPYGLPCDNAATYVGGALNWTTRRSDDTASSWIIGSLDLATETYKEVSKPAYEETDFATWRLGVLGDLLCVLCHYSNGRVDVWAMKDYGVSESWTRLATISFFIDPKTLPSLRFLKPLGVTKIGEILLQYGSQLVIYNPKENTIKYPKGHRLNNLHRAHLHVDSLVSPNVDG